MDHRISGRSEASSEKFVGSRRETPDGALDCVPGRTVARAIAHLEEIFRPPVASGVPPEYRGSCRPEGNLFWRQYFCWEVAHSCEPEPCGCSQRSADSRRPELGGTRPMPHARHQNPPRSVVSDASNPIASACEVQRQSHLLVETIRPRFTFDRDFSVILRGRLGQNGLCALFAWTIFHSSPLRTSKRRPRNFDAGWPPQ